MVCYTPIRAYRSGTVNAETGKRAFTFSGTKSLVEGSIYSLPCGNCIGCRVDRAEGWAIRCSHEAKMSEFHTPGNPGSVFITLTFDAEHLPANNSVCKRATQLFMKKLRERLKGTRLRFMLCGEYGELNKRAHYHVLLFGYRFPDREKWTKARGGQWLYKSKLLSEVWPYGNALIGEVTYQSSRYVGGYVVKKLGGKRADEYWRVSPVDGETYQVEPEFATMSLKPGLGETWFSKFHGDVFPHDHVIVDGRPRKPPRYYEKLYGEEAMEPIKRVRKRRMVLSKENSSPERRATREEKAEIESDRIKREFGS